MRQKRMILNVRVQFVLADNGIGANIFVSPMYMNASPCLWIPLLNI